MTERKPYPTDLSDQEWSQIAHLIDIEQTNGKPREHSLRDVLNALFYMDKTGCHWRMLPHDLPLGNGSYWFDKWRKDSTLVAVNDHLNRKVRKAHGREEFISLGIIDSQSVKTAHGYDGNKKVKGRKRHLLTDVMGLVFAVVITAANVADGSQLIALIEQVEPSHPRLETILADGVYGIANYPAKFKERFQDREKPKGVKGFNVIPKQWIVERTNAWNGNSRRLPKDYEKPPKIL